MANATGVGGIYSGLVTLNAANASTVVLPAGGVTLNSAALTEVTYAGQIAQTNAVTLNGLSTLTLVGNNTLDSLVFNNNGGTTVTTATNPTVSVAASTVLTLSNTTPITAASMTAGTIASIPTGSLDFSGASNVTLSIAPITVNSQSVNPLTPTLNIAALIQNDTANTGVTGGVTALTIAGGGLIELSGASTFTGGVTLTGDSGLDVAASSGSGVGPIGTGTLAIGSGSYFTSTAAANSLSNAFTVAGDFSVQGILGLTLAGAGGFSSAESTITVAAPQTTFTLSGPLTGYAGMTLTKAGAGILVLSGSNTFSSGSTIAVTGGQLTASGAASATPTPLGNANVTLNGGELSLLNNGSGANSLISYPTTITIPSTAPTGANLTIGFVSANTGNIVQLNDVMMTGGQTLSVTENNSYTLRLLEVENSSPTTPVYINAPAGGTITIYSYTGAKPQLSPDAPAGTTLTFIPAPSTAYWSGSHNANWDSLTGTTTVATNWLNGAAGTDTQALPASTTNVFIGATTVASGSYAATLGQDFTINSLTFTGLGSDATNPMSILGTNTLTLMAGSGSGITVNSGAAASTISANVAFGANQTWTNSASTLLTIGGTSGNTVTGGYNLTLTGSGNITISDPIQTGTGSLTMSGSGTLVLGGVNTYTGGTIVSSGTVQLGAAGAGSLATTGNLTVSGTLDLNGNSQQVASLSGSSSGIIGSSNSVPVVLTVTGTGTYSGVIKNAVGSGTSTTALVFNGPGNTLALGGANIFTGGTTITAGTVQLASGGSLVSTGNLTINGGNFDLSGNSQQVASLSGTSGFIGNSGSSPSTLTVTGTGTYSGVIEDVLGSGFEHDRFDAHRGGRAHAGRAEHLHRRHDHHRRHLDRQWLAGLGNDGKCRHGRHVGRHRSRARKRDAYRQRNHRLRQRRHDRRHARRDRWQLERCRHRDRRDHRQWIGEYLHHRFGGHADRCWRAERHRRHAVGPGHD